MKLSVQRTTIYYVGLVIALVIIANCNGGGGGGTTGSSANAPVVSEFRIRALDPERAFRTVRYLITARVTDPNNDLIGGRAEFRVPTTGETESTTLDSTFLQGDRFAAVLPLNPVAPGRYEAVFSIVDAAGNRSNEIPFFVTVTAQVPRGRPEVPRVTGPIIDRLRPAR